MMNELPLSKLNKYITQSKFIFVITGANGWIGKALIHILSQHLGAEYKNRIIPISNSSKTVTLKNGLELDAIPFNKLTSLPKNKEYILFHFAFLTKEKLAKMNHEGYLAANLQITHSVESFLKTYKIPSMVYASSGAVYNHDGTLCKDLKSNPYGSLKAEDEQFFLKTAEENSKLHLVIPRIFNLAGPYINKWQDYAISNFILQALNNNQIVINSPVPVIRSYIHIYDLITILLLTIFEPYYTPIIFDTAGIAPIELYDLAVTIRKTLNIDVEIIKNYNLNLSPNYYCGDSFLQNKILEKYNYTLCNIENMVLSTLQFIQETLSTEYLIN